MTENWRDFFLRRHQVLFPEGCEIVLGPASESTALHALSKELDIEFPDDFCELYRQVNGVGIDYGCGTTSN